jgi:predicted dehydrogenase
MSALRIGVVGGGAIAGYHLPRLRQRADAGDVELVALADVNPAASATAEKFGVARFVADYREMLAAVDAVLVCIPTHLHADVAVDAIRAGRHVFLEKPVARTMEQARRIADAAASSNVAVQVGFVRRFDEEWLAWRQAVRSGAIGRPVVWRDAYTGHGPAGAWFNRDDQGGGPFLDGTVHNYDFALHTFGPAAWVQAHLRTMRAGSTAFDTGTATIHFASGDELVLLWSWGVPPGVTGQRVFEFLGPAGAITWPRDEPPEATQRRFVVNRGPADKPAVHFEKDALTPAFARQMDEFIDVAQGRRAPTAGLAEGVEALLVALAVLESGRSGAPVNL